MGKSQSKTNSKNKNTSSSDKNKVIKSDINNNSNNKNNNHNDSNKKNKRAKEINKIEDENKFELKSSKNSKKGGIFSPKKKENQKLERDLIRKSSRKRKKITTEEKSKENSVEEYEISVQQKLKKLLQTDSEKFLLNFMLLSIQFYGNYERETYDAIDRIRKMENEKTKKIGEHFKRVLLSDPVSDAVDKKVKFQARHGPLKNQLLSLDTQTMFVIFDNIEVSQPDDECLYSTLSNTPAYKFVMEDHLYQLRQVTSRISHKGYVKLRSIDIINSSQFNKNTTHSNSATPAATYSGGSPCVNSDEENELDSVLNAPITQKKGKSIGYMNGIPFSTTSVSSASRASSEYAYIMAFNSHKPLKNVIMTNPDEPLSTTKLPVTLITLINREDEIELDDSVSDEEEEQIEIQDDSNYLENDDDEKESTIKNTSIMGSDQRPYLNSRGFLSYFINIFRSQLAFELGFNQEDLEKATWKAAAVFVPPYEIIPAIHCPWPTEAFEWGVRKRNSNSVPFRKEKYVWPTSKMISDVINFGCHVIPVGYAPKKGENPNRHIEWKIVFPQAERYLENKLTSAQIKVYMMMKTLFKSFIDIRLENGKNVFTKEHLRTQLFWLCEENFLSWNEEYLGEALMRYMKALLNSIQKHCLPDYFLRQRNLLDNVPERVLANIHRLLYRIYENPVFYVMSSMRNLCFTKNFYPPLPIKKLYHYLIIDDPLHLIPSNAFMQGAERKESSVSLSKETVALGSIGDFEKRDKKLKRRKPKLGIKDTEDEKVERRNSVESINVELKTSRSMDPLRLRFIFNLFIRHLIEMTKMSKENGALNNSYTYLQQAERITQILKEYGDTEEAETFLSQIDPMKTQISKLLRYNAASGPSLPIRRESVDPPYPYRKRSQDTDASDETIRTTKFTRAIPQSGLKVKAQVHGSQSQQKKSAINFPSTAPLKDNVRIRA